MSDRQQLVEAALDRPVIEWIKERREAGRSWVKLSYDLFLATGLEVSFETLRRWYAEQVTDEAGEPAR
jgi:hypothetical protein